MGFLVVHYLVDTLLFVSATRAWKKSDVYDNNNGPTKPDETRRRLLSQRAHCWVANNVLFAVIFLLFIGASYQGVTDRGEAFAQEDLVSSYREFAALWLLNCLIAYAITGYFSYRERREVSWEDHLGSSPQIHRTTSLHHAEQWRKEAEALPPGKERDGCMVLAEGYANLATLIEEVNNGCTSGEVTR